MNNPTTPVCVECGKEKCPFKEHDAICFQKDYCHTPPCQPKEEAKGERCEKCGQILPRSGINIKVTCGCSLPTNPKKEDWEEEFDDKFHNEDWSYFQDDPNNIEDNVIAIKSFISLLLAEADLKARREQHRLDVEAVENAERLKEGRSLLVQDALSALDRVKPESRKE